MIDEPTDGLPAHIVQLHDYVRDEYRLRTVEAQPI